MAYEKFLQDNPQYLEKVTLLMIIMPSRESVEQYKNLKKEMDELVGRMNSQYGTINWMPIWYFYRQLDLDEIIEYYVASDIALITPIRDGMNLIAKEYLASKPDKTGVLILSEMAGAAKEMGESIIVNPNDHTIMAQAIKTALELPPDEQIRRNQLLHKRLQRYTDAKWADDFINALDEVKKIQKSKLVRKITPELRSRIKEEYTSAGKRIIFLDYDGTLTEFHKNPMEARPDNELYGILKAITKDKNNKLVIISGRDKETLGKWFGSEWKLGIIAEHGVWNREPGQDWLMTEQIDKHWMDSVYPTLEFFVDRTPRSFIEEKNYSLVWHYRNTDPDLGMRRSWELKDVLKSMASNLNLEIMDGDKVIEIKNSGINKGRSALLKMGSVTYPFILAIGDDWTDEYTFEAMPEEAITIKVGTKSTKADYYIESVRDVRDLLKELAG
jgi:trehalose 6-phosphate synthase/phosphatase